MALRRAELWKAATPMGFMKTPRVATEGAAAHREARAVCLSREGRTIEAILN